MAYCSAGVLDLSVSNICDLSPHCKETSHGFLFILGTGQ
jgi:hypothetical protein